MMLLALSFMICGSVMVVCGLLREFSDERADLLPDIKPVSLDELWGP